MEDARKRQVKIGFEPHSIQFPRPNDIKDIEMFMEDESKYNQTGDWAEALSFQHTGSFAKTSRSKSPNVISRLYEWDREKETKLKEVRDTYMNNYSFTPRINEVSKILVELDEINKQPKNNSNLNLTKK